MRLITAATLDRPNAGPALLWPNFIAYDDHEPPDPQSAATYRLSTQARRAFVAGPSTGSNRDGRARAALTIIDDETKMNRATPTTVPLAPNKSSDVKRSLQFVLISLELNL